MAGFDHRHLAAGDFPGVPEKLLEVLNDLSGTVAGIVERGIGLGGLRGREATVTLVAPLSGPLRVSHGLGAPPAGVLVLGAEDTTTRSPAAVAGLGWSVAGDGIHINAVGGLTDGHTYSLRLFILGR